MMCRLMSSSLVPSGSDRSSWQIDVICKFSWVNSFECLGAKLRICHDGREGSTHRLR